MTEVGVNVTLEGINADLGKIAIVHTARMDWERSPSPSVWRKRLDLTGSSEKSRVTSVVRYDPDSSFPPHPHPDGEEILVLEGTFSDEHGDYPAGTFLLNPDGFSHAPFSKEGCVLFVKLRQYPGRGRAHFAIDINDALWQPGSAPGIEMLPLYAEEAYPERISLVRFAPGAATADHDHPGGEELFILDGKLEDKHDTYVAGSWVRYPVGSRHVAHSPSGCTLYVKRGHLPG